MAPAWLREALGADLTRVRRLRWGFTNESWAATSGALELVGTRMADPAAAAEIVRRGPELARRLAAAGIVTPAPIPGRSRPAMGVVVTAWVDGTPGMELLGAEDGGLLVGRLLGRTWRRLREVDPTGLELDDLWARAADLADEAHGWLDAVTEGLTDREVSACRAAIGEVPALLDGQVAGFVHGDLVPVNVLVRGGEVAALLDLEAARLGEPLLDAAWFSWIVRYHHPEAAAGISAAFLAEAGVDVAEPRTGQLLAMLPIIRLLEILGRNGPLAAAGRWLDQLRGAIQRWHAGGSPP